MKRPLVLVLGALVALSGILGMPRPAVATAHPYLLFGASDIPALRTKILTGIPAEAWAELKARADAYVTPGPSYIFTQQEIFYPDGSVFPNWRVYDDPAGQNQVGTYLTDLGVAYALSGDTRYSSMAIQLMLVEANSNFPVWVDQNGPAYDLGNGDLSKGMAIAWDLTYDEWQPADRATYIDSINRNATSLLNCLYSSWAPIGQPGNNHYSVCGGGTGLLLLALQGEPGLTVDTATLLSNARSRVLPYFQQVYGQYGDGSEGFNYTAYGLHNALPFAFAWKRATGEDLLAEAPGIANVPRWVALEQIPGKGGRWVDRNDSNETLSNWQEVLPMLFGVRPDGLTAWDWDHTFGPRGDDIFGSGEEPAYVAPFPAGDQLCTDPVDDPTRVADCWISRAAFTIIYWQPIAPQDPATFGLPAQYYPEHGLVDFRTGWSGGQNEIVGTFEVRHDGVHWIHHQQDDGQFTLLGYGGQWAVDSGYAGGENNAGASGHNLITVDCASNEADTSFDTYQPVLAYGQTPGQVYVAADESHLFHSVSGSVPWGTRRLLFTSAPGEPPTLTVADSDNVNGASHTYCWNLHTDAANGISILGHNFGFLAPSGAALAGSTTANGAAPDFLAEPYVAGGAPSLHTVLQTQVKAVTLDQLTVMILQPQFQYNSIAASAFPTSGGNYASLTWPGGQILVLAANHGSSSVSVGTTQLVGAFGKFTVGRGESVLESGSSLASGGITYVSVTGGSATVLVGGDSVTAEGAAGLTYHVYAPQAITSVLVNGGVVAACRSGAYLDFPC